MYINVGLIVPCFKTSKFFEHNTENEEFEKSRVLQKCPLTHITLIIIIIASICLVFIEYDLQSYFTMNKK